ncbi:hypothetical protein JCM10213_000408 [Rhodosporidiobolus nylandii]
MLVLPLDGADGLPDPTLEVLADLAVSLSRPSRQVVAAVGSGVSTNAGIPDFRGHAGLYAGASKSLSSPTSSPSLSLATLPPFPSSSQLGSPLPSTSSRSVLPSIPQHGPQRTKRLFSYSSLLDPTSRSQHLQLMAGFHDRARAIRKSLVPSGTGGRSKKGSRKGKERAVDEGGTGAAPPPTAFHALLHELNRRDQLARVWSQNIDGLEGVAGLEYVDLASLSPFSGPTAATTAGDDSASDWEAGPASRRPHKRRRLAGPSAVATKEEDQREREKQNRGKVVALHGTLGEVVCSVCGHRERWKGKHSRAFREGQAVACGRCEERAATRKRASKRTTSTSNLSFLRPAVLLYDDPTPSSLSTSAAVSSALDFDLSSAASPPDFLLVAGTTLRIPGFKGIVKEVSRAVRANGGTCVMVNRETVGNVKEWDGVFDYFCAFLGDTDTFASHMSDFLSAYSPLEPPKSASSYRDLSPLPTPSSPPPQPSPLFYRSSTSPRPSCTPLPTPPPTSSPQKRPATTSKSSRLPPSSPLRFRSPTPQSSPPPRAAALALQLDLDLLTSPQQRVLGPAFLPSSRAPSPKKRFRHALRPASLPGQHAPSVSGQEGESIGLAEMLREAERECFTPTEGCPGCADGVAAEEDGQVGKRARAMERALGELSAHSSPSPAPTRTAAALASCSGTPRSRRTKSAQTGCRVRAWPPRGTLPFVATHQTACEAYHLQLATREQTVEEDPFSQGKIRSSSKAPPAPWRLAPRDATRSIDSTATGLCLKLRRSTLKPPARRYRAATIPTGVGRGGVISVLVSAVVQVGYFGFPLAVLCAAPAPQ